MYIYVYVYKILDKLPFNFCDIMKWGFIRSVVEDSHFYKRIYWCYGTGKNLLTIKSL